MKHKVEEAPKTEEEKQVEMWKVRNLIKHLESAKGNGTSMISLIIPPDKQVSVVNKMLAEEYGTASNIKSRVNRLSVQEAIVSTQQRLKLFPKVPNNGLVIYSGTFLKGNKEKKMTISFEPFKPINTSLYLCDNKFHTEPLSELLQSNDKFGFVVMDGNGCLFGTLCGNTRNILHKFSVDLPKKHGRGGQSALRFARLRLEKRHNYVRKVAELSVQFFISSDKPNVTGIILAGSADFKKELAQSDLFDQRLQKVIINIVDIPYGGEQGFNKAIELSMESLKNVKFIHEKKVIDEFFKQVAKDSGKYVFGVSETLRGLEMGCVKTLIVWDNLKVKRITLSHSSLPSEKIIHLTADKAKDPKYYKDPDTDIEYDVKKESLLEWLAENYKSFGCKIEFVTDRSQEGSQFVNGFGGIGGILRYRVDFEAINTYMDMEEEDDLDEFI